MKKLFKSKKIALGISGALICATSIVAPVSVCVSCGANKKFIDSIDEQFNVSSATYNAMKKQLKTLYRAKLEKEWVVEEDIKNEMNFLEKDLDSFDHTLQQSEQTRKQLNYKLSGYSSDIAIDDSKFLDYTSLTNGLIELAQSKYEVQLTRDSTATWDDLRIDYKSLRDSTEIYMHNTTSMSEAEIEAMLQRCDAQRDEMMKDLMQKYGSDALSGLINGLPRLIGCFDTVNLEIAAIAATNMLKDFFSKFTLVFNEKGENNEYDVLDKEGKLEIGSVLDKDLMKRMFIFVEQKSGNEYEYDPENMLPGYTLTPVLHDKMPDPIHNTYKISIDWSIINNTYLNSDETTKERATGHIYGKNQDVLDGKVDDDTPLYEVMQGCEREYLEYQLYPTASFEASQIGVGYFNPQSEDGYIRFKWHDIPADNKYEYFFAGIKDETGDRGTLTLENLADSGLQISENGVYYTDVKEILDRVGDDKNVPDEDALTLSEKFVRNCNVKSNVVIVNGDDHIVTNDFQIEYKNSHSWDDDAHWYRGLPTFHNNGYPVSPEFFTVANKTFNDARRWVDVYRQRKINDIYDEADNLLVSLVCSSVKAALYTAYYVYRLFVPLTVLIDGTPRPNWAVAVALVASNIVMLAAYITLVTKNLIIPMRTFSENNDKFLKSASFKDIAARIDQDAHWFCPMDENDKYDTDLYDIKMKEFCSANFQEDTRPLYQFYSNFHLQPVCEAFVKGIEDYEVDSIKIEKVTDKITLPIGSINLYSDSYTIVSLIVNTALGPTTNPFKPWKWGLECWLWIMVAGLDLAISGAISGILYIVSHTIKKFVTGKF